MTYEEGQAITLRWLADAGIGPGQRVLDVGAGPGSVTALLLEHIGPDGSVVGLDRDAAFLEQARARHAGRPVVYREVDLAGPLPDDLGTFDAIVGRRVLMYLPDPVGTLRSLARLLRPGGVVFFQEFVLDDAPSALPLHDTVRDWLITMLRGERASWTMGAALPGLFAEAGLGWPVMRAEIDVATPGQPDSLVDRIRFVLGRLAAAGIDPATIDVETLSARLHAERAAVGVPWMADRAVAAWARR
jgi:SAM-dependent methyltransferase